MLHAELVAGVEHVARPELGIFQQSLEGLVGAGDGAVAHLGYDLRAVRAHRREGGEAERRGRRAHAAPAAGSARSGGAIIRPPSLLPRPHRSAVLRPPLVPVLGLGVGADALGAGGGLPAAAKRSGAVWEPRSGPQQRSAQVGTPWDSGSDGVGGARWAP